MTIIALVVIVTYSHNMSLGWDNLALGMIVGNPSMC